MVDTSSLVQRVIVKMISFVQALVLDFTTKQSQDQAVDKQALIKILRFTKSFLAVIDENKKIGYKLAILAEFLDAVDEQVKSGLISGYETLADDILQMETYIETISSDPAKQQVLLAQVTAGVNHFINPNSLYPPTVVFWLKEECNIVTIKKMHSLMLFVSKDDHAKILQHDPKLLECKKIQLLLNCLAQI